MLKRILVGLAGHEHADAEIAHAIELAKCHDAKISALTVLDTPRLTHVGATPIGGGGAAHELREHRVTQAKQRIAEVTREFEAKCQDAGVICELKQETGNPDAILIDHSRFQDLMIFALHSGFDYGVISDGVDPIDLLTRLIKGGVRPILAVQDDYHEINKVIVALSGSIESARTLKQFVRFNPFPAAAVRIVTFGKDGSECETRLEQAAEYCSAHGLTVGTKYVEGTPMGRIIEEADDFSADAIVMGNSAKSLLSRAIFGETAEHCLRHADRPIFLNQ